MKKTAILSFIAVTFLFAMILAFNPLTFAGSGNPNPGGPGTALPDSIQKFVQRACMDCHADDGSSMAKGKVNFSKWDTYDAEKQVKKASAICKVLTKGSMPKKSWCANNPNDVPTQAEKDMVCRWAGSLQK
jgi:hypothetical protein